MVAADEVRRRPRGDLLYITHTASHPEPPCIRVVCAALHRRHPRSSVATPGRVWACPWHAHDQLSSHGSLLVFSMQVHGGILQSEAVGGPDPAAIDVGPAVCLARWHRAKSHSGLGCILHARGSADMCILAVDDDLGDRSCRFGNCRPRRRLVGSMWQMPRRFGFLWLSKSGLHEEPMHT